MTVLSYCHYTVNRKTLALSNEIMIQYAGVRRSFKMIPMLLRFNF